ncbi:hypothetical protein [Nitrosomonas eutropha]|uniref:Uncharacterized protein n=2 Tax=Nitrosomonas eutropha TaxID=916 RepID=A0ABX5M898_9PROT|nr:hypothetical protein [Nitrosomonas eutropha]ABI59702.1 conserved hypothetical protein [Nitrosomonas eutropha C91]PXV82499.1 hypothetical protein C8R14_10771 [Nitrosomonas eutropha]
MIDKTVTMLHIRKAGMCSRGTRDFFLHHGLDWGLFLKQGIEAEKLAATGDAMALQVVKIAREEDGQL